MKEEGGRETCLLWIEAEGRGGEEHGGQPEIV